MVDDGVNLRHALVGVIMMVIAYFYSHGCGLGEERTDATVGKGISGPDTLRFVEDIGSDLRICTKSTPTPVRDLHGILSLPP